MSERLVMASLPLLRNSRRHGFMKRLNWCCSPNDAAYMRQRQAENLQRAESNPNENWMANKLRNAGLTFSRQIIWGYRLFDFWNHKLRVAIEVDGAEHDAAYDNYRDEYNFRRSGIVVLRVRNRNEADAELLFTRLRTLEPHKQRRQLLGISPHSAWLVKLPYPPSFLKAFLDGKFNELVKQAKQPRN